MPVDFTINSTQPIKKEIDKEKEKEKEINNKEAEKSKKASRTF